MSFVSVAKAQELADGSMRGIDIAGHELLIARVGDHYYAASNRCSHMGARLSEGTLAGTMVTCPRHGSQFDLSNGQVIHWTNWPKFLVALSKTMKPIRPLPTYKVKVDGTDILVDI
ncbi:Rieske (2Fe-2S) protein [Chloroflexota bacterium]